MPAWDAFLVDKCRITAAKALANCFAPPKPVDPATAEEVLAAFEVLYRVAENHKEILPFLNNLRHKPTLEAMVSVAKAVREDCVSE